MILITERSMAVSLIDPWLGWQSDRQSNQLSERMNTDGRNGRIGAERDRERGDGYWQQKNRRIGEREMERRDMNIDNTRGRIGERERVDEYRQ